MPRHRPTKKNAASSPAEGKEAGNTAASPYACARVYSRRGCMLYNTVPYYRPPPPTADRHIMPPTTATSSRQPPPPETADRGRRTHKHRPEGERGEELPGGLCSGPDSGQPKTTSGSRCASFTRCPSDRRQPPPAKQTKPAEIVKSKAETGRNARELARKNVSVRITYKNTHGNKRNGGGILQNWRENAGQQPPRH